MAAGELIPQVGSLAVASVTHDGSKTRVVGLRTRTNDAAFPEITWAPFGCAADDRRSRSVIYLWRLAATATIHPQEWFGFHSAASN